LGPFAEQAVCARFDCTFCKKKIENLTRDIDKNLTIAVMGCVVNGPGEAKEADIGVAGGLNECILFKKGELIRKIPFEELLDELMKEINGV